jgi:dolichol-phosphate hexosyltransferase
MINRNTLVSIVLPTLNEEDGIINTLYSIPKSTLLDEGYNLEVLVIDGNSTDNTATVAKQLGAKVIIENRKGYGRAYKTGFASAAGDIIVTLDADDTYPAELIPEYIAKLIKTGSDFITVNRFSKMEKNSMSLMHKIGNKILSITMNFLFSIKVHDSQSGMWIMKKSFLDKINLNSDDMCLSEEIKIIAFKFFKSLEVDGQYTERAGEPKLNTFSHGWLNFRYLFHYKKLIKSALFVQPPPVSPEPITEEESSIRVKD